MRLIMSSQDKDIVLKNFYKINMQDKAAWAKHLKKVEAIKQQMGNTYCLHADHHVSKR